MMLRTARTVMVGIAAFAIVAVAGGCWLKTESVTLTFANRTDTTLCHYGSEEGLSASRCRNVIPANHDQSYRLGCGDGPNADKNHLTVIVAEKQTGLVLFRRTEECAVWQDSERTLLIESDGGSYEVSGGPP